MTSPTNITTSAVADETDLESELLEAIAEMERGDYIEVTPEQLERWAVTGESPWPDESPG